MILDFNNVVYIFNVCICYAHLTKQKYMKNPKLTEVQFCFQISQRAKISQKWFSNRIVPMDLGFQIIHTQTI